MQTCDIENCNTEAKYDARIPNIGSWAYVCEAHFRQFCCTLGVGRGSLLNKPESPNKGKKLPKPSIDDYSEEELAEMMFDSVIELDCGCTVEPDGRCPCGNNSPLIDMGLI